MALKGHTLLSGHMLRRCAPSPAALLLVLLLAAAAPSAHALLARRVLDEPVLSG